MFRLIGWFARAAIFSLVVLVLGAWIRWDGHSVSDRIQTHLSSVQRSAAHSTALQRARRSAGDWISDATDSARQRFRQLTNRDQAASDQSDDASADGDDDGDQRHVVRIEHITDSERQKLRALMKELNTSSN